jgi:circadian clock protein KaiB
MAKPESPLGPAAQRFEASIAGRKREHIVLRLFVTGMSARSQQAIAVSRRLCEEHLHGHYELHVIDIYQQPELAKQEQLIAAPTLIRKFPLPQRRLVGSLDNPKRLLALLGISEAAGHQP